MSICNVWTINEVFALFEGLPRLTQDIDNYFYVRKVRENFSQVV